MLAIDSPGDADDAGALGLLIMPVEVEISAIFNFWWCVENEEETGFASLLSPNLLFNTAIAHFRRIKSIKDSLPKFPLFSSTKHQINIQANKRP